MAEQIVLTDLVNLQNETTAVNAINSNNTTIEEAFLDVLSLRGTAPNQMQSPLDMNSNQIINLPDPATANSPVRLQDLSTLNGGGIVSNIPAGGATGSALTKTSNTDYSFGWVAPIYTKPESRGGGTSVADNSAAYNSVSSTGGVIYFGQGVYNFTTATSTSIDGLSTQGISKGTSQVVRNYNETTPTKGLFNIGVDSVIGNINGTNFTNLGMAAGTGTTGGSLISVISGPVFSPDYMTISGCYLSYGTGAYSSSGATLYMDGSARTSGGTGLRDCDIVNCDIFANPGVWPAIVAKSVIDWKLTGSNVVGATNITGTVGVPSTDVIIDGSNLSDLNIDHVNQAKVDINSISGNLAIGVNAANVSIHSNSLSGNITVDATATNIFIEIDKPIGGTITNNSTTCYIRSGGVWVNPPFFSELDVYGSTGTSNNKVKLAYNSSAGVGKLSAFTTGGTSELDVELSNSGVQVIPWKFTNSGLQFAGSSSGTGNLITPAAVGSPNWTLPTGTGTFAVSASAPLSINSAGNLSVTSAIPGTTTNDNAIAGNIGEYIESIVVQGSAVPLTTSTAKTVTSISLTAGDWDVSAIGYFLPAGTTNMTFTGTTISLVTNTLDTTPGRFNLTSYAPFVPGALSFTQTLPPYRLSLATTTTVFLVVEAIFTVSTMGSYGHLHARRVR